MSYEKEEYTIYLTNRRIIGYSSEGVLLKKDSLLSVGLEEVKNLRIVEMGLVGKKGILVIETDKQIISIEGQIADVKDAWQEINQSLNDSKGFDEPSPETKPEPTPKDAESAPEISMADKEKIMVLKMRMEKGAISEDEFQRAMKDILED